MPPDVDDLSVSVPFEATCPLCRTTFVGTRWLVVDIDRRPELEVRAGDGSLQRTFCPACIGPGVEEVGTYCIVRRAGAKLEVATFVPWGTADIKVKVGALHARLRERSAGMGIPVSAIEPVGSTLFKSGDDIYEKVTRVWPDVTEKFDPTVLSGAIAEFLNATDPADHARILLAHPDLARPNIDRFLRFLGEKEQGLRQAVALAARSFADAARRSGVPGAVREAKVSSAPTEQLFEHSPELAERWRALLRDEPKSAEEIERALAVGHELVDDLGQAGFSSVGANVLCWLGDLHRRRMGPDRAAGLAAAIGAYEEALDGLDPDALAVRCGVWLRLSSCWDIRPDGDRGENLERALACARMAEEAAATLGGDLLAEASMEVGILYTRRLTGDGRANLVLAREALDRAVALAPGSTLSMMARYNQALTYIEEAPYTEGRSLVAGIAMLELLAKPEGLAFFEDAHRQNLFQSLGAALAWRATQQLAGDVQYLDRAADFIRQALAIAQTRQEPFEAARNASLLAQIETDRRLRGRNDSGLDSILALLDEAAAVVTRDVAPFEFARNQMRRAAILGELADLDVALPLIVRALEDACSVLTADEFPDLSRRAHFELGRRRLQAGEIGAAAQAFMSASDASEHMIAATETVSRRAQEVDANAVLHDALVDTLARLAEDATPADSPDAAWRVLEATERGRARLYLDMMGFRTLPPFPDVPESLRSRESALIAELDWSVPMAAQTFDVADSKSAERLHHRRSSVAALESLWSEIERCGEGGRRHVALRRSRPPNRMALMAFAGHMGSGVSIVSFFVLADRLLAVLLRAGAPTRVVPIALPKERLHAEYVESFKRDVLARDRDPVAAHAWLSLGEALFGPFVETLAASELLVVVPHGDLHALPLHALTVAGRPLIEHVPVIYGPSIGVLATVVEAERGDSTDGQPLVVSHALSPEEAEEFADEADAIAREFGAGAHHRATRAAIMTAAPRAGIIHLACHGYFAAADPLQSGVVLADGVMTAHDWLTLSLRSDLVTLSACETGQQEVRRGDEMVGLARALLQAGSASVLLTLWRVYSDATAEWMTRFYGAWASGPAARWARARAFQRATLALRASDPDPVAWAPFVLSGDPG